MPPWKWVAVLAILDLSFSLQNDAAKPEHSSMLKDQLSYYEILEAKHVQGLPNFSKSRGKRSTEDYQSTHARITTELTFKVLGREFHLYVYPKRDIFAQGFSAHVVGAEGQTKEFVVDSNSLYSGHVEGERHSSVDLSWETDSLLNAKIATDTETYYIEPSRHHFESELSAEKSMAESMIAYRASDVVLADHELPGEKCGGGAEAPVEPSLPRWPPYQSSSNASSGTSKPPSVSTDSTHRTKKRQKRQSPVKNTCPLLLVADYRFFDKIAFRNEHIAANYMLDLISQVNKIYRRTYWIGSANDQFTDMGFQVKKIIIRNTSCPAGSDRQCATADYNCIGPTCTPHRLLEAFAASGEGYHKEDFTQYCLAHLFTAYKFEEQAVLGLAYMASPPSYDQGQGGVARGGICSPPQYRRRARGGERAYYVNSGWSNSVDRYGNRIITERAQVLLAHELGHNWGSEHDPGDCAPGESTQSGNHIMYSYSVSGAKANHKEFSTCSRRSIGIVLEGKADRCFTERIVTLGGNFLVDNEGEECDAGPTGDNCCTSEFLLRGEAECSDQNSPCCLGCKKVQAGDPLAGTAKKCQDKLPSLCTEISYCDGTDMGCPVVYTEPGRRCMPEGRCFNNSFDQVECRSLCKVIGLNPCQCSDKDQSCFLCCDIDSTCQALTKTYYEQHVNNATAPSGVDTSDLWQAYDGGPPFVGQSFSSQGLVQLPDSSSCPDGVCQAGECKYEQTGLVERLWTFFSGLTPSAFVIFMKDNIVGTSIIFSILLWAPFSIWVCCKDRQLTMQLEDEDDMTARTPLIYPQIGDMLADYQHEIQGTNGETKM